MTEPLSLRPAAAADVDRLTSLLARNDLPTADVAAKIECFWLAYDDRSLVGVGGLERRGQHALVRSVVVVESMRGEGYGQRLLAAIEARASTRGVTDLYLLTTTAAGFFERLGFQRLSRETAPRPIRETEQFETLCPETAVCMRKVVGDR